MDFNVMSLHVLFIPYYLLCVHTVNLEIFLRVLFSRNFAAKLHGNKILLKWRNHSFVTNIGKSCLSCEFLTL